MYVIVYTYYMNKKNKKDMTDSQQAFIKEVSGLWPLARGSLSEVRKPCVRKGCKVCEQDGGHSAWIFTYREGGKLKCLHVRPEHAGHIRQAIANGRKLEALLAGLGRQAVLHSRQAQA
jgi:hypothetical protein